MKKNSLEIALYNEKIIEILLELPFLGIVQVTNVEIKADFKSNKIDMSDIQDLFLNLANYNFYICNNKVVVYRYGKDPNKNAK